MAAILIVEDDPGARGLLARILEPLGHTVMSVESAESALELIAAAPPAIAFCDVHLPSAGGLWLAERIREMSPATAIILATGDATVPPRESLRKGVVAYILKPFVAADILRAVEDGIRWHEEQARRHPRVPPEAD